MTPVSQFLRPSRREFLAGSGAGLFALSAGGRAARAAEAKSPRTAFFVIGDTHYLANREAPSKIADESAEICGRLVDTLNRLPGTAIPQAAGGGEVLAPQGVIHAGDIIDTGDKQGTVQSEMQKTEWASFADDYGLTGKDGRLKYPVYEIAGNHDAPHGKGVAIDKMIERNRARPAVGNVSDNGVHYSWDWNNIHFINLGLIVGTDKTLDRKRRYAALDSLDFLKADLAEKVGDSGRLVVITHHVDIARYTGPCDRAAPADSKEWDTCDVRAFYDALQNYRVGAIFYGHTHARNVFQWDGESPKAKRGIHVFNTDNASHFHGNNQAVFYVEVGDTQLTVREYQTKDRWETGEFTPQVWHAPLPG